MKAKAAIVVHPESMPNSLFLYSSWSRPLLFQISNGTVRCDSGMRLGRDHGLAADIERSY
jgi:hypothetical protein